MDRDSSCEGTSRFILNGLGNDCALNNLNSISVLSCVSMELLSLSYSSLVAMDVTLVVDDVLRCILDNALDNAIASILVLNALRCLTRQDDMLVSQGASVVDSSSSKPSSFKHVNFRS